MRKENDADHGGLGIGPPKPKRSCARSRAFSNPSAESDQPQSAEVQQLYALGGLEESRNELIVKVVNPTPESVAADIVLKGLAGIESSARVISLGQSDFKSENRLDQPGIVIPEESTMMIGGAAFEAS